MNKFGHLARNSGPHRNAAALTLNAIQADDEAFEALIDSLTPEEMRRTMAALALQASTYCATALGGDANAVRALRRAMETLAAMPTEN